jgi:hypothetical protein
VIGIAVNRGQWLPKFQNSDSNRGQRLPPIANECQKNGTATVAKK